MYKLLMCISIVIFSISCSSPEEENESMENQCDGSLTTLANGQARNYGAPTNAFLVKNELVNGSELGIIWTANGININLQLVIDLGGSDCVEARQFDLTDLPSNVSIFSIQYTDISNNKIATVSNAFFEEGDSGFIELKSCDGVEEKLDVSFGFSGTALDGENFIFSGSAEDVCFKRTK